jgi:galactokinase
MAKKNILNHKNLFKKQPFIGCSRIYNPLKSKQPGSIRDESYNSRVSHEMELSHTSIVSTPELDLLVNLATKYDSNAVFGSRMTGGGFGGCTVTLLKKSGVGKLVAAMKEGYNDKESGRKASFFLCSPAQGARIVML